MKEESDFDLKGFSFSIDAYAVKHILKNPDIVFYDGKNKLGKDCFQFQKTIGNKYIIIKEVRTGKKQLALNTMRVFLNKKEN